VKVEQQDPDPRDLAECRAKTRRRSEDHDRQRRLTPAYLLEPLRELLGGFDLDPCTEPDNPTGARAFFSLPADGCSEPWGAARTVFVNPPYGEARARWIDRCIEESSRKIALLIPCHTETRATQRAIEAGVSTLFIRARLRFGIPRENGRSEAASHGSILVGLNLDLSPLAGLGVVLYRGRP